MNIFQQQNKILNLDTNDTLPNANHNDVSLKANQIIYTSINNILNKLIDNDLYCEKYIFNENNYCIGPKYSNDISTDALNREDGYKYWDGITQNAESLSILIKNDKTLNETLTNSNLTNHDINFIVNIGEIVVGTNKGLFRRNNHDNSKWINTNSGIIGSSNCIFCFHDENKALFIVCIKDSNDNCTLYHLQNYGFINEPFNFQRIDFNGGITLNKIDHIFIKNDNILIADNTNKRIYAANIDIDGRLISNVSEILNGDFDKGDCSYKKFGLSSSGFINSNDITLVGTKNQGTYNFIENNVFQNIQKIKGVTGTPKNIIKVDSEIFLTTSDGLYKLNNQNATKIVSGNISSYVCDDRNLFVSIDKSIYDKLGNRKKSFSANITSLAIYKNYLIASTTTKTNYCDINTNVWDKEIRYDNTSIKKIKNSLNYNGNMYSYANESTNSNDIKKFYLIQEVYESKQILNKICDNIKQVKKAFKTTSNDICYISENKLYVNKNEITFENYNIKDVQNHGGNFVIAVTNKTNETHSSILYCTSSDWSKTPLLEVTALLEVTDRTINKICVCGDNVFAVYTDTNNIDVINIETKTNYSINNTIGTITSIESFGGKIYSIINNELYLMDEDKLCYKENLTEDEISSGLYGLSGGNTIENITYGTTGQARRGNELYYFNTARNKFQKISADFINNYKKSYYYHPYFTYSEFPNDCSSSFKEYRKNGDYEKDISAVLSAVEYFNGYPFVDFYGLWKKSDNKCSCVMTDGLITEVTKYLPLDTKEIGILTNVVDFLNIHDKDSENYNFAVYSDKINLISVYSKSRAISVIEEEKGNKDAIDISKNQTYIGKDGRTYTGVTISTYYYVSTYEYKIGSENKLPAHDYGDIQQVSKYDFNNSFFLHKNNNGKTTITHCKIDSDQCIANTKVKLSNLIDYNPINLSELSNYEIYDMSLGSDYSYEIYTLCKRNNKHYLGHIFGITFSTLSLKIYSFNSDFDTSNLNFININQYKNLPRLRNGNTDQLFSFTLKEQYVSISKILTNVNDIYPFEDQLILNRDTTLSIFNGNNNQYVNVTNIDKVQYDNKEFLILSKDKGLSSVENILNTSTIKNKSNLFNDTRVYSAINNEYSLNDGLYNIVSQVTPKLVSKSKTDIDYSIDKMDIYNEQMIVTDNSLGSTYYINPQYPNTKYEMYVANGTHNYKVVKPFKQIFEVIEDSQYKNIERDTLKEINTPITISENSANCFVYQNDFYTFDGFGNLILINKKNNNNVLHFYNFGEDDLYYLSKQVNYTINKMYIDKDITVRKYTSDLEIKDLTKIDDKYYILDTIGIFQINDKFTPSSKKYILIDSNNKNFFKESKYDLLIGSQSKLQYTYHDIILSDDLIDCPQNMNTPFNLISETYSELSAEHINNFHQHSDIVPQLSTKSTIDLRYINESNKDLVYTYEFGDNNIYVQCASKHNNLMSEYDQSNISGISYIRKSYIKNNINELFIHIPTTNTYYLAHTKGIPGCEHASTTIPQINVNKELSTDINSNITQLSLMLDAEYFNISCINECQINGCSLPLKIFTDTSNTLYQDGNRFLTIVKPSMLVSENYEKINNKLIIKFICFGQDEQSILIRYKSKT